MKLNLAQKFSVIMVVLCFAFIIGQNLREVQEISLLNPDMPFFNLLFSFVGATFIYFVFYLFLGIFFVLLFDTSKYK